MASPPKIYKQSKSPLLNSTNTATVGDIWIDLNDVPATIKTLVTATGVTAYWTLKKSEILGSEISLSGQTPKSIESDDSILFKIGGRNNFKISSATIPGGRNRGAGLLSAANPTGEIDVTPVPYDSYSRNIVTNFSDESGGGFAFKVGEEKLMTLRSFRSPAISNRLPTPLEGQVVIGDPTQLGYLDMSLFNNAYSAKLVVNGNLHIGNSTYSNFMSFGGTWSDGAGAQAASGHTYIGERIYESPEKSELIIFKGNDPKIDGYDTGPDRIRYISALHEFQTYLSNTQGTFFEVATTSSTITRMTIASDGAVAINQTLKVEGKTNVSSMDSTSDVNHYGAVFTHNLPLSGSAPNLFVETDGRLKKSTFNLNSLAGVGIIKAYGRTNSSAPMYPNDYTLIYSANISSSALVGSYIRFNFASAMSDSNYIVICTDVAGSSGGFNSIWIAPRVITRTTTYFEVLPPGGSYTPEGGNMSPVGSPIEFIVVR